MKAESFLSFLAGAAAGTVLGILFAPAPGNETREKLKKAAEEGYDEAKDIAGDVAHDVHVRARYARREMNALKKTVSEQAGSLKDDVKSKILEQLDKLEQALSAGEEETVDEQA